LANEVAAEDIRVNAICPGAVATPMIMVNAELFKLFRPDTENPAPSTDKQRMRRHEPNH
jgi:NAD(P)-dependent dehydrogenase (short-subunit alcohol dehydrogenase family)